MCVILKKYRFLGTEYLICDLRGAAFDLTPVQLRLLCDRREGIGADRFFVCAGTAAKPHFRLFAADGSEVCKDEASQLIFQRQLQDAQQSLQQSEIFRALGDRVIVDAVVGIEAEVTEVRLTDSFMGSLRAADLVRTDCAS